MKTFLLLLLFLTGGADRQPAETYRIKFLDCNGSSIQEWDGVVDLDEDGPDLGFVDPTSGHLIKLHGTWIMETIPR